MPEESPIALKSESANTPTEINSTDNILWTKVIPRTNRVTLILSFLLVFGLDLWILITSPSLFPFWAMMLANFAAFMLFFYLENFIFYSKFANIKSKLDPFILTLIILRNGVFILNYIPLIQLLGLAIWVGASIPAILAYLLLLWFRSKKS